MEVRRNPHKPDLTDPSRNEPSRTPDNLDFPANDILGPRFLCSHSVAKAADLLGFHGTAPSPKTPQNQRFGRHGIG